MIFVAENGVYHAEGYAKAERYAKDEEVLTAEVMGKPPVASGADMGLPLSLGSLPLPNNNNFRG
jgi:hypothetical protein